MAVVVSGGEEMGQAARINRCVRCDMSGGEMHPEEKPTRGRGVIFFWVVREGASGDVAFE